MATKCFSLLQAAAMRVTRLDAFGRPVYGDCSQVVSDGIVTVQLSAETEEGEEISVTKANGQTCISQAPCEQLRWYTVETTFCQVDPDLVQIMNPTWDKVLDADGNVIGYNVNGTLDCSTGFAFEIWPRSHKTVEGCSAATTQGEWGYLLLPWVAGGAPGDLEIGNNAISFSFTGKTKLGSGWRRGPYPVQIQPNGAPGPLLQPIGPDTHYRIFATTVRPPEPECGCQPVDRPTPEPAEVTITGIAGETERRTVRLQVNNHGFGPVTVAWGDNTTSEIQDCATAQHTYAEDGTYTITIADKQSPAVNVTKTITIPLPPDEPGLELTAGSETDRFQVAATISLPAHSTGQGSIDWGDGTEQQNITVGEDGTLSITHTYTAPGVYTVTVRRSDFPTLRTRQAVAVPIAPAPTVTVAKGTGDNDAKVTWDNGTGGPVTLQWGDGSPDTDGEATGEAEHTYPPGEHTVTVLSKANPASKTEETFTIPLPALLARESLTTDPDSFILTVQPDSEDRTGHTVKATVSHPQGTTVEVTWGDDLGEETITGDGETPLYHGYADAGTYTITATDPTNPARTATRQVTVPHTS